MSDTSPRKKWAKFLIRWTIAVVGIGWVLWKTPLYNSVLIVGPGTVPIKVHLRRSATRVPAVKSSIRRLTPFAGSALRAVNARYQACHRPGRRGTDRRALIAFDLSDDLKTVERLLIEMPDGRRWIPRSELKCELGVPAIDQGIIQQVRQTNAAVGGAASDAFLITGLRWHLLSAVSIRISGPALSSTWWGRWNTFRPGSTGGDVAGPLRRDSPPIITRGSRA
jgi:hypothetical protein